MAKNVKINGVTYSSVPSVEIPLADNTGTAKFFDTSSATATTDKILAGYKAYVGTGEITGNATVPTVSQDSSTKVISIA